MITDFICTGREQAISLSDLSAAAGIPERSAKREILEARIKGHLICSNEDGYFFAETADDLRDYVRSRQASIKTSRSALVPFLKALRG